MVMTYEAYVIHYASSSQPVTMLCLTAEAFCALAKAILRERTCSNVSLKFRLHWLTLTTLFWTFLYWLGNELIWIWKTFHVLCSRKKGKSRFGFFGYPLQEKCADCVTALYCYSMMSMNLLCAVRKINDTNMHTNTIVEKETTDLQYNIYVFSMRFCSISQWKSHILYVLCCSKFVHHMLNLF